MRTRNVIRNWGLSLLFQLFMLVCGVIFPRLIILTYGSVVNGMTQTVNQIINVLNLLQAGAVGASVFMLFKPVADDNYDEINSIMAATERYFIRIGNIFFVCLLFIIPILAWFKSNEGLTIIEIVATILLMGGNALFYFYFYSWYDVLFQSYQQQYIFSIGSFIDKVVYYILLMIILVNHLHFLLMYVALLIGSCTRLVYLNVIYRKRFSQRISRHYEKTFSKISGRGYLLVNQIAIQIVESTPILLISFYYGLSYASIFSVYYMVYGLIKTLINTIHTASNTSFGNYIATKSNDEIKELFNLIQYTFTIVGTVLCICCASLFMPFIKIYTMDIIDVNYIIPLLVYFGVIYIAIYVVYIPYYMLTNSYGLFKEIYRQSIVCCVLSLLISIVLGIEFGLPYVVIGCITYYIMMTVCRRNVSQKNIVWVRKDKFVQRACYLIAMIVLGFIVESQVGMLYSENWFNWIITAILVGVVGLVFSSFYSILFERREMKQVIGYINIIFASKA